MQHGRYIKAIKSILQQKYHNYHIVYIDDKSTDGNL
jgi:glycosyltransferase involved in cell wall biosynthesis